jgi:hypothetical protein
MKIIIYKLFAKIFYVKVKQIENPFRQIGL